MRLGVRSGACKSGSWSLLAFMMVTLSAGWVYSATDSQADGYRAAPVPPTLGIESWDGVTAPGVAQRCEVDVGQSLLITDAKFTIKNPFLKRTIDIEPAEDSFSVAGFLNLAALVTGDVQTPEIDQDSVGSREIDMPLPRLAQLGQFPVEAAFGFEFGFGGILELNPFCEINPVPATVTPTKIVWKSPKGATPVVTITVNPMTGEFSVDCQKVSLSDLILNPTDTVGARGAAIFEIVPLFFGIGFDGLEGYGVSIVGAVATQKNEDAPIVGTYKYAKVGFPLDGEFFVDSLKIDQREVKFGKGDALSRVSRRLFEHRATLSAYFLPDIFDEDFELCEGVCLGIGEIGECIDAEDFTVNADETIFTYRRPRGEEGVFVSVIINLKTGKLTAVTDWFEEGAFSVNGIFDGVTYLEENQIVEVNLELACEGEFSFGALVAPYKKGWSTGIPRILTSTILFEEGD
ncbi:MAG: hypothetical protein HS116_19630 [Planctomycetes bacterium]|nr:hypothetical protein [Planctomycetota bacterium]